MVAQSTSNLILNVYFFFLFLSLYIFKSCPAQTPSLWSALDQPYIWPQILSSGNLEGWAGEWCPFLPSKLCSVSSRLRVETTVITAISASTTSLKWALAELSCREAIFPFSTWSLYRVGLQRFRTGYRDEQREKKDFFLFFSGSK